MDALVVDKEKGELVLFGRRHTAIEAQALCDHLDSLVGVVVSEVIMNNLETRLGKADASRLAEERPKARLKELLDTLIEMDRLSGVGITSVHLQDTETPPVTIQIKNPSVKGTRGAARAFLFSWWCGALSALLSKNLEVKTVAYDEEADVMRCEIAERQTG